MQMKNLFQKRLLGLVVAVLLTGFSIAFLTLKSQWHAGGLRAHLNEADSQAFRIADEFADRLRQLNDALYHYGASHVDPDVAAFRQTSQGLDRWIEAQKGMLATEQERALMEQIDVAYHDYLKVASELVGRLGDLGDNSASMDEYDSLRRASRRLFELRKQLNRAHLEYRARVLADANHSISELRILVLIALGLLFLFAVALAVVVYRDMIVPLRVKLVESETLRERQEKLASLGMLAAGVAHEIRNPLTAIKGAMFLQQKRLLPDTQQAADAKIINREILRLERIVNDFLLFARPGDSNLVATTTETPLREVHALLAPQLAKGNIQLIHESTPALPITADEEQIKQVLINLVRNAAESIGRDGVVKLRARHDYRRLLSRPTDVVILEVEDNGKGIPSGVEKRLFDPFFTTKSTGTGLGLSIAARIVQSHGGQLEYQTAPGVGTTFGIVLPSPVGHPASA
jgi:signal transduction histidine kinase